MTVAGSNNTANVYQNDMLGSVHKDGLLTSNGDCGTTGTTPSDLIGFASQAGQDGLSTTTGGGITQPSQYIAVMI